MSKLSNSSWSMCNNESMSMPSSDDRFRMLKPNDCSSSRKSISSPLNGNEKKKQLTFVAVRRPKDAVVWQTRRGEMAAAAVTYATYPLPDYGVSRTKRCTGAKCSFGCTDVCNLLGFCDGVVVSRAPCRQCRWSLKQYYTRFRKTRTHTHARACAYIK